MKPIALLLSIIFIFSFTGKDENAFPKKLQKKYAFIPAGELMIGDEKKSIDGFYMMKTEVSNLDYQEFLYFLKIKEETEKLEIAKVHSDGWDIGEMEPIKEHYFSHPAYHEYPVVNITKEGAQLYCDFLKNILNETNAIKGYKVKECRLPNREEWMMAAHGGEIMTPYPWGGHYLRNSKGEFLANFKGLGSGNIAYDYENETYKIIEDNRSQSSSYITAPIFSYHPNGYDMYNMSGNVAEMVADKEVAVGGSWKSTGYDVRIESEMPFKGYSPEVGFRPLLILEKE